jgi:hypothetical protein
MSVFSFALITRHAKSILTSKLHLSVSKRVKCYDFTCVFVFYRNYPARELHIFTAYFVRSSTACLAVLFIS